MAILRGDSEVEGWSIFWRVLVHSTEDGRRLVHPYYLNKEGEHEGLWLALVGFSYPHYQFKTNFLCFIQTSFFLPNHCKTSACHMLYCDQTQSSLPHTCGPATFSKTIGEYAASNSGPLSFTSNRGSWTVALPVRGGTP